MLHCTEACIMTTIYIIFKNINFKSYDKFWETLLLETWKFLFPRTKNCIELNQWCKYFSTLCHLLTPDCQVLGSSYSWPLNVTRLIPETTTDSWNYCSLYVIDILYPFLEFKKSKFVFIDYQNCFYTLTLQITFNSDTWR